MKNLFLLVALTSGLLMVSCAGEPETPEVIVVPVHPEQSETIIIEKAPAKKTATIVLDENGVKVEAKKIDIEVKGE